MSNKTLRLLLIPLTIFLIFNSTSAFSKTVPKPIPKLKPITKTYTRLFYCQNGSSAVTSFTTNWKSVDVLAPQAYSIDGAGTLTGGINPPLLALARQHGTKLMPLVVNKGFSSAVSAAFLDDPAKQQRAIDAMVAEAISQNFWGWQIDFEQIDVTYKDKFTKFISDLNTALDKVNRQTSVAVIAQTSRDPNDYPKDYWYKFIGVFDYAALATSSDFISLMSYDDPWSKGPVTRFSWLKEVINFSLKSVPAEKISIGIPLYYWRWNNTTGKRVAVGTYKQLVSQMNQHYVKSGYSQTEQTAFMTYTSQRMKYTIWYENSQSVKAKTDLIKKLGLHGFSAWALGQEVPSVHQSVASNSYQVFPELAENF